MAKFFDTCSLLNSYDSIFREEEYLYISSITLCELENIKNSKTKDENLKYRARQVSNMLIQYENKINIVNYNIFWDIKLIAHKILPNNDSRIVVSAYKTNKKDRIMFITDDNCCYNISKSFGLSTKRSDGRVVEEIYTGYKTIPMDEVDQAKFYAFTLQNNDNKYDLIENQYLLIQDSETEEIIDSYKFENNKYSKIEYKTLDSRMFGTIKPKDELQKLAIDSLLTNQMTWLAGPAGAGKSLLSCSYMFNLLERGKIDCIIIFCNTVATKGSAKLGFYPGSRTEKLMDSQIGNFLISKLGRDVVEKLMNDSKLFLLPMSDIRGFDTSGMNAAIYITEAQNLDIELLKLSLQRIGDDCICILDGDDEAQVDLDMYDGSNNGLREMSKVFRGEDIYGQVKLNQIYRSRIAQIAQKMGK